MQVTATATFCATLVEEWSRSGVTDSFVAPGSRSTPLTLALAASDRIALHLFHDERSASFAALGHGLATERPGIVVCTSGTAAAHLHAAMIEADLSSVPMIVCTANRPPELWEVGAPQTIDQTHLYGRSPRWFMQPGVPDDANDNTWRPLARRSVREATGWRGQPGPVHLDLSFRDPLVGLAGPLPAAGLAPAGETPAPSRVVTDPATSDAVALAKVLAEVDPIRGGVIVAGRGTSDPDAVLRLGDHLGWPVIADHRSGCRVAGRSICHNDSILRVASLAEAATPAAVLRFGETLSSKVTEQWLTTVDGPTIVATRGRWIDPHQVSDLVLDDQDLAAQLHDLLVDVSPSLVVEDWLAADEVAATAIAAVLDRAHAEDGPSEPGTARAALRTLAGTNRLGPTPTLVVSSSMPVRDVEWYGPAAAGVRVLANRGANGIDGVVATAIGVALTGAPTICLIGDVALLHDSTSLIGLAGRPVSLTLAVVDNDGGGIFSFLPQRRQLDPLDFEQLFGTPHGTDLAQLAAAHHIPFESADTETDLTPNGLRMVVTTTERQANTALHADLNQAVATALDQLGA